MEFTYQAYRDFVESALTDCINNDDPLTDVYEFEMAEIEKTLRDRIGNHYIKLYNYLKHDGAASNAEREKKLVKYSATPTGVAMLLNEIPHLGCVDIDVDHDISEDRKQRIRNYVLSKLSDDNVIEQTGNGGLHIYCQLGMYPLKNNATCKKMRVEDGDIAFDVDLFGCVDRQARRILLFEGIDGIQTNIIKNADEADEALLPYRFIRGSIDSKLTRTMFEVLTQLGLNNANKNGEKAKSNDFAHHSTIDSSNNHSKFTLDKEVIELLVDGIDKPMECHNWVRESFEDNAECKELGLWNAFPGIYAIEDRKLRNQALDNLQSICTDKANSNFEKSLSEFERYLAESKLRDKSVSLWYLLEMIKKFNPEYYETVVEPKYRGFQIRDIDFADPFDYESFKANANRGVYKTLSHAATDLSKIYRYKMVGTRLIAEKTSLGFVFMSFKDFRDKLKDCRLFTKVVDKNGRSKEVEYNAYDAFKKIDDKITFSSVKFKSYDPRALNLFHGYVHQRLQTVNMEVIQVYLDLIRDAICGDYSAEVYNYVIRWMAWILQNPGEKIIVSIIMKGKQGSGKNRFVDILRYLLYPYSGVTTSIDRLIKWNSFIEGKAFVVCNELQSETSNYVTNIDSLKAVITDNDLEVNEKNVPIRDSENVANFIFISNHHKPIIVPADDRRYVVLNVNGVYTMSKEGKAKLKYLYQIKKKFEDGLRDEVSEFFNNLFTYFMNIDLSDFDPTDIPDTTARIALIESSFSDVDRFIVDHYDSFVKGLIAEDVKRLYRMDFLGDGRDIVRKDYANFCGKLKDKCLNDGRHAIWHDGHSVKGYKLKPEYLNVYDPKRFNPNDSDEQK